MSYFDSDQLGVQDVRSVLKFVQDTTGIRGYDRPVEQGAERPFFVLAPPRGTPEIFSAGWYRYKPMILGTLFVDDPYKMQEFVSRIATLLMVGCQEIPLISVDAEGNWIEADGKLDDCEFLNTLIADDALNFQIIGQRYVSEREVELPSLDTALFNKELNTNGT
ncbi:hypothetical protein [Exiguobacterium sp. S22-S28]|uniref:hypothetical protein n=1 Tax=Exiguobacterium sp. S22-S28 TaxID=3342768 RepID=UPI00372D043A